MAASAQNLIAAAGGRPLVMGVLNVTPDSFSDGGLYVQAGDAIARAKEMLAQGADIIDVGGESTRPGADPVSEEEELKRVLPVAEALKKELPDLAWSIDTQKAAVADAALELGACLLNDISSLRADEGMTAVAKKHPVPLCLMHRLGQPSESAWSTTEKADYGDKGVVDGVLAFLKNRAADLRFAGIDKKRIWIDPGLGFGKSVDDNLKLLRELERFTETDFPVLVGASRKSMLGAVLDDAPVEERLEGSLAVAALAAWKGAACIRVHDVAETARVVKTIHAIKHAGK